MRIKCAESENFKGKNAGGAADWMMHTINVDLEKRGGCALN
jgi:hypothetical protein